MVKHRKGRAKRLPLKDYLRSNCKHCKNAISSVENKSWTDYNDRKKCPARGHGQYHEAEKVLS